MLDINDSQQMVLSIPRPQQGLAPFQVDLRIAFEGERRIQEIATASPGNAPFLASQFTRAYSSLSRAYGALYHEVASSTVAARKRRAVLILDKAPAIAKEKGLASPRSPTGSEDVREAICYQDAEYTAIEEYRAAVEAAKEYVFCKLQAMRMAYEAVRAIIRGTSSPAGNGVVDLTPPEQDPFSAALALTASEPAVDVTPPDNTTSAPSSPAPRSSGFGTPRY